MGELKPVPVPELTPEGVRVFIATPDLSKQIEVERSLEEFGLGDNVQVAMDWREAAGFMFRQKPGELEANVFLLDGQVGRGESTRSGDRLMYGLLNMYKASITEITKAAKKQIVKDGLAQHEVSTIFSYEAMQTVAARRLGAEALLVGISGSSEGALSYPAQIPFAPPAEVGRIIFEKAVTEAPQQATTA